MVVPQVAGPPFARSRPAWYEPPMNKLLERAIEEIAALPEDQQEVVAARILDEVRRRTVRKGKWAEVADRLARLDLLRGRSAEF